MYVFTHARVPFMRMKGEIKLMKKTQRAFTLIELLVVVLIIGILTSVAVSQYRKAVTKARVAEALTILKRAQDAFVLDHMANGIEPSIARDIMGFTGGIWREDGTRYCTKNFEYDLNGRGLSAMRFAGNTGWTGGACPSVREASYMLYMETPYAEGEDVPWHQRKDCTAYDEEGHEICQTLSGGEFTVVYKP